ncbi:MAG TPA: winged helix DNA-binding domain-containing protein [Actinomycetota bacterium]|nr:winged helix DNA-binding domain-containing protein [Actinomycetota bacterium]
MDGATLNRAVLARQCLLQRSSDSIPRVLEQMGGLQAQYAPSSYVGLWSRRAGMERAQLDRALEDRAVVQGTLMRVTIHLVSQEDYWPFAVAVRRARQQAWLRLLRGRRTEGELEALAERARELLAGGPVKRHDALRELGGIDNGTWIGIGLWADMVRVPPSGTWDHRRADLYALAETWIGPPQVSEDDAIHHTIRRYLNAFGPAYPGDLASWSGLAASELAARLREMELAVYRDDSGRELFDLPDAPLPEGATPAPVRFLPTWDASLLVHCRRSGILPEEYRPRVFQTKTPHSVGTFTVDGRVAGTWKTDGKRIVTSPFAPLDKASEMAVEDEAEGLEAFVA